VHFDNAAWGDWIQKTAGEAAADALDAYGGVWPSFTLKKLVIHEPGCSSVFFIFLSFTSSHSSLQYVSL
jgi:hypothetical protein